MRGGLELLSTAKVRSTCKLSLGGLKAHDVGDDFNALHLLAGVVDFDFDRGGSRRRHAVIGDFLVDDANEMRTLRRRV